MRKRGQTGDQMMVFVFAVFVIMLGGGIAAGAYLFFGSEYDFRGIDAEALNYRVRQCLSEKEINWDLTGDEFKEEFYSKCRINRNVTEENLFIHISIDGQEKFDSGKWDLTACKIGEKNEQYVRCIDGNLVKNVGGNQVSFVVWTGSDQKLRKRMS